MSFKLTFALSAIALSSALVTGCSKEPVPVVAVPAASAPVEPSTAVVSVFAVPELRPFAEAADLALKAMLAQATASPDAATLIPLTREFMAARDTLREKTNGTPHAQTSFREIMQKNLDTPQSKTAYALAISQLRKANKAQPSAPAASQ
jgi:hypothetical protein